MRSIIIFRKPNGKYYITDKNYYAGEKDNIQIWQTSTEENIIIPPTESNKILLRTDIINKEIKSIIDNRRIFK